MGRIKTRLAKSITTELYERYADEFTTDFEQNKKVLVGKMSDTSKKIRNVIAGYATRLKKAE
ncbi:30S ribosomal protein S17e [Candidatus Woesearchaeota archaeon]|nr:30S ribosomal protein S17e [Candidatus Woesearchaeota archaeon]MCF7900959.1 30S ribosomal protein S17e [Candidatus Woesearchaeota archaeon]MCF8013595.1 30S ribosomal protein S17e [Candidatus Woesearchaeota archaeon]